MKTAPASSAAPILEVDASSLTTYLASPTSGQDVEPGVDFRGVDLDGRLRKSAPLGIRLAGNPIGPFGPGTQALGGVALMNGAVTQEDIDLAFPADGPRWVIGRTYNARQDGGSHVSNGFQGKKGIQGKKGFQTAQAEIQVIGQRVVLVYGADRFVEYKQVDGSATTFRGVNGAAGALVHQSSEGDKEGVPDLWTLTDQAGWEFTFFGFDDDCGAKGQLWKIEAPSGELAFAGDSDLANDPITLGYNGGRLATAYDSEDRRYSFTYATLDSAVRLTEVKVETKSSGTWGSPVGVETLGKVEYFYYSSEPFGETGDFERVNGIARKCTCEQCGWQCSFCSNGVLPAAVQDDSQRFAARSEGNRGLQR